MVDAYTAVSNASSATANLVQAAFDKYVEHSLRHMPILRDVVDKRPVSPDKPGGTITFNLHNDLAVATTPLNEITDPDFVAMPATNTVTVTLNEYGNVTAATKKAREFVFSDLEPAIVNNMTFNMADSLDVLVREILSAGTNVVYAGDATSTVTIGSGDKITSANVRKIVTLLRDAAAVPKRGELYWCGIHPKVAHDLKAETGAGSWRDSHIYAAPGLIWRGEVGVYEGAFFVESSRMKFGGNGASNQVVYRTLFAGQQALAEATAVDPHLVLNPNVPDRLRRLYSIGWYGLLGWAIYRQAALYRLESSSSLDPVLAA